MSKEMTVAERLKEPFPPEAIGWKPQSIKGGRALAVAYIDARDVMNRLDDVLGTDRWEDTYEVLPGGSVICTLTLRFPAAEGRGTAVTKQDIGSQSDQSDEGDRLKAAFSDALKRAAVKFGIGRYLYGLPIAWHEWDEVKKQFRSPPALPAWALPKGTRQENPDREKDHAISAIEDFIKEEPSLERFAGALKEYQEMKAGPARDAIRLMLWEYAEAKKWKWDAKTQSFLAK